MSPLEKNTSFVKLSQF